jgi:hypothetical protein
MQILPPVFTWFPLPNLPQPPEHFIQRARDLAYVDHNEDLLNKMYPGHKHYKHRIITYKGKQYKSRCQHAKDMGPDWEQWVKENICADIYNTSARMNITDEGDDSPVHGPHVDGRFVRIFYLIDQGHDNAKTEFYLEPGKDIIRPVEDLPNDLSFGYYNNIDELTVIDRAQFPVGQWIIVNGCVLHGVVDVNGPGRLNLVVSVRPEFLQFDIVTRKEKSQ